MKEEDTEKTNPTVVNPPIEDKPKETTDKATKAKPASKTNKSASKASKTSKPAAKPSKPATPKANKDETDKAAQPAKSAKATTSKAAQIAKQYGVSEVYENSRGEFFVSKVNAINSESDESKVTIHSF